MGPTAASPFKPDLRGLVNDGQLPPADVLSQMAGLVAQETWANLQPTAADNASGTIVHPNQIDRLLNYVQRYAPVAGLRLKIRVWTGMYSPDWARTLGGASVPLNNYACASNPQPAGCNGGSQTIQAPRWWSPAFQAAYDRFQAALGRAYDSNPLIAEVSSPRCMVVWDEPLVRPWDQWSMTQLLAAGYSEAQDVACQEEQLTSLQAAWPHTIVSFAVNPYINIDANGGAPEFHVDLNTTASLMSYCRQQLGDQCLLQNDELGRACSMPGSPGYSAMYTTLAQEGTPLAFMVDTPAATAGRSLSSILGQAVSWHANSVEIGSPYTTSNPGSFFATYNSQLAQDPWG